MAKIPIAKMTTAKLKLIKECFVIFIVMQHSFQCLGVI